MSARRESERRLRALIKAGLVKRNAFERRSDNVLERASVKRIDRIWDRVGHIISNPEVRPFVLYRPRTRSQMAKAEKHTGVPISRFKDIRALPIETTHGAKGARIRVGKDSISLSFKSGPITERVKIRLNPRKLITDPAKLASSIEAKYPDAALVIRTGAGTVSPLEHRETLQQTLTRLTSRYSDWRKWLTAVEAVQRRGNGHGKRRKRNRSGGGASKAKRRKR